MGDKARKSSLYYLLLSLAIIALDQATKLLVLKNLSENESVSVIGDLFYIRFIYNEGGAMGTSIGPAWVYTILTLIALVLIIKYFRSPDADGPLTKVSLAVILGGAIGNLIDRVAYGKVVDFIDIDIPDIPILDIYRWFTFNIADAAITVGLVLFGLSVLLKKNDQENGVAEIPKQATPNFESDSPKA